MSNLLDKASIILTPTAYNTSEVLCVKPSDGTGDFDFSRATEATRINSLGLIETIGINLPRINYEGGCGSWLFEPQSTNLVPYSEDFTQWTASGDTTIESGYLSPDGANNAYKISGTNNNIKTIVSSLTGTSQRTIFARTVSGTGTAKLFTHRNNTNNLFTITEQWQRFEVNSTTVTTSQTVFFGIDFRGGSLTEIILWGANATNDQDYATSYVPSNGSSVTRNQDVCTGSGSASLIDSTQGVLYAEIKGLANSNDQRRITLSDGTNNNRVVIFYNAANQLRGLVRVGNVVIFAPTVGIDITQTLKVALKWKENDFALWVNGVEEAVNLSGITLAADTLITLDFSDGNGVGNPYFGKTKCLAVWKEPLTDAELTALTTI